MGGIGVVASQQVVEPMLRLIGSRRNIDAEPPEARSTDGGHEGGRRLPSDPQIREPLLEEVSTWEAPKIRHDRGLARIALGVAAPHDLVTF